MVSGPNLGRANLHEDLDEAAIIEVMNGRGFLPPGATPGDFNADGQVDTADFMILADNFNTRVTDDSFSKGDFDLNLRIDLADFLKFRALFAAQGQGEVAAVPEPTSLWSVGIFGAICVLRVRSHR